MAARTAGAQALQDSRDDEILEETSTSPTQEAAGYVAEVRAVLAWLLAHYEGGPPIGAPAVQDARFEWRDCQWTAVAAPSAALLND